MKEILGKTSTSGAHNSCGAHSIAVAFSKLLIDGILEQNHLLETDAYKELFEYCKETCKPPPTSWDDLKETLISKKTTNEEAQQYLAAAIRKFTARATLHKKQDYYDSCSRQFEVFFDEGSTIEAKKDSEQFLLDFGFEPSDIKEWKDHLGDKNACTEILERCMGSKFTNQEEYYREYNAGVLEETVQALGFAVKFHAKGHAYSIKSPINPIALVDISNNGNHWTVNSILIDEERKQLVDLEETNIIKQLISLGYPNLFAKRIVEDPEIKPLIGVDTPLWQQYHSLVLDNHTLVEAKLEQYKIEEIRNLVIEEDKLVKPVTDSIERCIADIATYMKGNNINTPVAIKDFLDKVPRQFDFSEEYKCINSGKSPHEKLLILGVMAAQLKFQYGFEDATEVTKQLNNPQYYPVINETCQNIFNNLSPEIQKEIYADTNDYMLQYNMKSIEGLISVTKLPIRKKDEEKQPPTSIPPTFKIIPGLKPLTETAKVPEVPEKISTSTVSTPRSPTTSSLLAKDRLTEVKEVLEPLSDNRFEHFKETVNSIVKNVDCVSLEPTKENNHTVFEIKRSSDQQLLAVVKQDSIECPLIPSELGKEQKLITEQQQIFIAFLRDAVEEGKVVTVEAINLSPKDLEQILSLIKSEHRDLLTHIKLELPPLKECIYTDLSSIGGKFVDKPYTREEHESINKLIDSTFTTSPKKTFRP